ncbi:hypothetical protein JCM9140_643 [Halalkalibacter wakoensis JCM 9140]|uniref:Lipoprotein n=1 Tax=Halalkalibacter wakoensis JCM 9140 TaxID=1236970 RepID=W4PYD1_9BACI|nr:DUF4309 domain-containing protein [Halalkalibacter wakoensis]GAE24695.1 hypothetical protein JCM9140_643 [Halalkalibacter wakoensis JCM 9140]
MKAIISIFLLLVLVGCGQVSGEMTLEEINDSQSVTSANNNEPFLSFRWIEKGYDGTFVPIKNKVDQSSQEIYQQFGDPISRGHYEGGIYWEYDQATYFFNPDTNRCVAIAINIEEHNITSEEMKRQLGTPDQSEMNEMDGFWMYIYQLGEYELLFETEQKEGPLLYAWLKKTL